MVEEEAEVVHEHRHTQDKFLEHHAIAYALAIAIPAEEQTEQINVSSFAPFPS